MKRLSVMLGVGGAFVLCLPALASDSFKQWWEEIRSRAAWLKTGPDLRAAWRVEELYVPPELDLARLRADLESHPLHPDQGKLGVYARRARGEDTREVRLWYSGDAWRCSQDVGALKGYVDFGFRGSTGWSLTKNALVVIDLEHNVPQGRRFDSELPIRRRDLLILLTGGLGFRPDLLDRVSPIEPGGSRWVIEQHFEDQNGAKTTLRAHGGWDAAARSGSVDRVEWRSEGADASWITSWTTKGWHHEPSLSLDSAVEVMEYRADGVASRQIRLVELGLTTRAETEALAEVPVLTGTDPVRGPMTFTVVEDYRDFGSGAGPFAPAPPQSSASASIRDTSWVSWERLGWILLLASLGTLIFVRIQRSRRPHVPSSSVTK